MEDFVEEIALLNILFDELSLPGFVFPAELATVVELGAVCIEDSFEVAVEDDGLAVFKEAERSGFDEFCTLFNIRPKLSDISLIKRIIRIMLNEFPH